MIRTISRLWLPLCFYLFAVTTLPLHAQRSLHLHIPPSDSALFAQNIRSFEPLPQMLPGNVAVFAKVDSATMLALGKNLVTHFQQKAFWGASIDSLTTESDSVLSAVLYLGPQLRWMRLNLQSGIDNNWLQSAGYREKKYNGKLLDYPTLLSLQKGLLEQAENNGYPFAQVGLDSFGIDSTGAVTGLLTLTRGRYVTFGDLRVQGDLKLPPAYLPNYLGLRSGTPYSRARVLRLRDQLRGLLFLESTANPTVSFMGNEAYVNLFLNKKRAGRFDFIVGLLPQPNASEGSKKLLLTGTLSAAFQNALNLGERFSVELERLRPETQKLDLQVSVPYLFGTPFGVDGRLNIFKRDSSWVDAASDLGVQYLFAGGDYVKMLWETKSSSLQKVDTLAVIQTRELPSVVDLRQNGFGLEAGINRLDYRFNPRRGGAFSLRTVAGFNDILRNSQIENLKDPEDPSFDYASLYDSVETRTARYRFDARGEYYIPFAARSTLKLGVRAAGVFSETPVYNNEQFRLGGNKLLRGFDEESLFATRYAVATAEVRLIIGLNSFLSAFTDYGYLENISSSSRVFLRPWGFGAGLNFETGAGIFGISVAAGRSDAGQSVDLRATKFHLGYVSLF